MDFTKYVDLLDKRQLYFSRLDLFRDPYEGVYPAAEFPIKPMLEMSEHVRQFNFINCWHMNEHESAAMWDLYVRSTNGVSIQSTFSRMKEAFSDTKEDIFISTIRYHDYETKPYEELIRENAWSANPPGSTVNPQIFKRKSFEHEQELRAIYIDLPIEYDVEKARLRNFGKGKYIPVNLDILIEQVYVTSEAGPWFRQLVADVSKKYDLIKPVCQSGLYQRRSKPAD
jgi:hypothetical protein